MTPPPKVLVLGWNCQHAKGEAHLSSGSNAEDINDLLPRVVEFLLANIKEYESGLNKSARVILSMSLLHALAMISHAEFIEPDDWDGAETNGEVASA